MRVLPLMVLLTGCTIQYPVWLGDEGVAEMCESEGIHQFTHEGVTKEFDVRFISRENMSGYCPKPHWSDQPSRACIYDRYTIYVTPGRMCPRSMAHELSHGFGMDFVDKPKVRKL